MDVHLYWTKVNELPLMVIQDQINKIPKEKQERISRMTNPKRINASLCAEWLLRYGIKEQYGKIPDISLRKVSLKGKPYYADGRIFFSLSHSGDYALAAVADQPVGADIQLEKDADYLAIAKKIYALEEQFALHKEKKEKRKQLFYQIWVCRESAGKREGMGIKSTLPSCVLNGKIRIPQYFFYRQENIYIGAYGGDQAVYYLHYVDPVKFGE